MEKVIEDIKEKILSINKFLSKYINKNSILILAIIAFVVTMFPICRISFYAHPSADDYSYGMNTMNKFETEGLVPVLQGTVKTIVRNYKKWQGTYSAEVLFTLSPTVFNDNLYFLTTFVMAGMLLIGLYVLFKEVLVKSFKIDKKLFLSILLIFYILAIETLPSKNQGLYWWNGASYYMVFFSLELIAIAMVIKKYFNNNPSKVNYILLALLIAFIAGGNLITALQQIILLVLLNIYLFFKKDKSGILLLALAIIGFGISAAAPGNAVRAKGVIGMNPIKAILLSFFYGARHIFQWLTPFNITVLILLVILSYETIKKSKLTFKYPAALIGMLYCILSAEFTPTLYSTSTIGEGRLWNIIYISFLLMAFISMYYLTGYIRMKLYEQKIINKDKANGIIKIFNNHKPAITLMILLSIGFNYGLNRFLMTSYDASISLKTHAAYIYDYEYKERLKILKDDSIKDVVFEPFSVEPSPIVFVDFTDDPKHWLNKPVKKIYNKNSVIVKKKEEVEE